MRRGMAGLEALAATNQPDNDFRELQDMSNSFDNEDWTW